MTGIISTFFHMLLGLSNQGYGRCGRRM